MEEPETRYAMSGDLHVAYRVLGDGPIDLLMLSNGTTISIDARDDEPHWRRFEHRLASFTRLIRYDPRGLGLSDPLLPGSLPTLEQWVQDAAAVLDAVGSERATLCGAATGGLVAMLFAATFPERTSAQVLIHGFARLAQAPEYPAGVPEALLDDLLDGLTDPERDHDPIDDIRLMAPSLAGDVAFRDWWRRAGRRGASPASARAMHSTAFKADLRAVLPTIRTPTLLLHRVDSHFLSIEFSRYLAEHLPDARLVKLPGRDHLPFAGDSESIIQEVEEFLTGIRGQPPSDRVLATILFTDIVGSTEHVVAAGDTRWHELLDDHDRMVGRQLERFHGRQVKTTGDGVLATFDGPARAIGCGLAVREGARQLGLDLRVGVHTGEVDQRGDDVAGIAVHIAARVQSMPERARCSSPVRSSTSWPAPASSSLTRASTS